MNVWVLIFFSDLPELISTNLRGAEVYINKSGFYTALNTEWLYNAWV